MEIVNGEPQQRIHQQIFAASDVAPAERATSPAEVNQKILSECCAGRSRWIACLVGALLVPGVLLLTGSLTAQDFSPSESEPAPTASAVKQANAALAASDFTSALKILTVLNTKQPHDPQILYDLGLTLEALDSKQPTAESYYRESISANPLFPASHVALGLLLARSGRAGEARSELVTATHLSDVTPILMARTFRALAKLDQLASNPTAASTDLLAALNLTSETPEDILLAAEIAESAADLAGAERAYRRYLALAPLDSEATAALAHVLLAQHRPTEASSLLAPALATHPGDPTITVLIARADLATADSAKIAEATTLLESLHTAHSEDANVARLLARVYMETGRTDQAEPLYAALLAAQTQTHPEIKPDPTLLADHAEALLRLHRPSAAEALLKQAIVNPVAFPTPAAYADALTHLAFAASESDDPRCTLQALALRAKVAPSTPSTLYLEATANDSLRQTARALDLYTQFLVAAGGALPDQERQARQRLAILGGKK